jgi:hypothetical protein
VVLRHASQHGRARPQQITILGRAALASCTRFSGLHERQSRSGLGNAGPGSITRHPFGTGSLGDGGPSASRRSFGAGSIGGRPRDDDDDDDAKSMRRQKFDALVERGKERLGPERVERLERLNEKRKVHAAYVREAGKGSELSMSERMKRLVSAYGPLALGFHVTTEVVVCGLFYLAVDHGLDVGALLRVVESMTGTDMSTVVSSGAGTLGVAYALTVALTGIPRTFLTIAATPYIARKLGWRPKKV